MSDEQPLQGEPCENENNAEKWPSQPVCNVHHLTVIPTVVARSIMLVLQQRSTSFVLLKMSLEGIVL